MPVEPTILIGPYVDAEIPIPIVVTFRDSNQNPLDLTGYTAQWIMRRHPVSSGFPFAATDPSAVVRAAVVNPDQTGHKGQVTYTWVAGDLGLWGDYEAYMAVTAGSSTPILYSQRYAFHVAPSIVEPAGVPPPDSSQMTTLQHLTTVQEASIGGRLTLSRDFVHSYRIATEAELVSGLDASLAETVYVTLTANRVMGAPINAVPGQRMKLVFTEGGAGSFTLTLPSAVSAPAWSLNLAAGGVTELPIEYNGANSKWVFASNPVSVAGSPFTIPGAAGAPLSFNLGGATVSGPPTGGLWPPGSVAPSQDGTAYVSTGFLYPATILADGPVAYFRANDTGTTLVDQLGTYTATFAGTVTKSVAGATTDGDTAVTFGSNGYARAVVPLTLTGDFSVEFWVNKAAANINPQAVYIGNPTGWFTTDTFWIGAGDSQSNDAVQVRMNTNQTNQGTPAQICDSLWHHVVFTRIGTTGQIYLDGSTLSTSFTNITGTVTGTEIDIGATNNNGTAQRFMVASLDEVAVYLKGLTAARVTAHYNAGRATFFYAFRGANDSALVHLAGAETVSGAKTFTGGVAVPSGGITGPTGRTAALVVAASNASALSKANADYVCIGANDDTTILAAYGAIGSNGKLALTEGLYTCSAQLPLNKNVWVEGEGPGSTTLQCTTKLGRGTPFVDMSPVIGNQGGLREMTVKGPTAPVLNGGMTANCNGVRLNSAMKLERLQVIQWDCGVVYNSNGGHEFIETCTLANNYYGLFFERSQGDHLVRDCDLTGNLFASVAQPGTTQVVYPLLHRSHLGFCGYGWYQEEITAPASFAYAATAGGGGSGTLPAGNYTIYYTYVLHWAGTPNETVASPTFTVNAVPASGSISVTVLGQMPAYVTSVKFYIQSNTAGAANGYTGASWNAVATSVNITSPGNTVAPPVSNPTAATGMLLQAIFDQTGFEGVCNGAIYSAVLGNLQLCQFRSGGVIWDGNRGTFLTGQPGSGRDYCVTVGGGNAGNLFWGTGFFPDGVRGGVKGGGIWHAETLDGSANNCTFPDTAGQTLLRIRNWPNGGAATGGDLVNQNSIASPANGVLGANSLSVKVTTPRHFGPVNALFPRATPLVATGQTMPGNLPAGYPFVLAASAVDSATQLASASTGAAVAPLTGFRPDRPQAPTLALAAGAGLGTGLYSYSITFVNAFGESTGGANASITTTGGNNQVSLSAIPTWPTGTGYTNYSLCTARKIYRTAVGGTQLKFVATLADNTTTTYLDAIADGSLGANIPTIDTSAGSTVTWVYQPATVANCPAMGGTGVTTATVPLLLQTLPNGTKICLGYGTANAEVVTLNAAFQPGAAVALTWGTGTINTHALGDPIVIMPAASLTFDWVWW